MVFLENLMLCLSDRPARQTVPRYSSYLALCNGRDDLFTLHEAELRQSSSNAQNHHLDLCGARLAFPGNQALFGERKLALRVTPAATMLTVYSWLLIPVCLQLEK